LKYKDLTIEIKPMWNVKSQVIPVIIGATGAISQSLRQYLSNRPVKREIREVQKTALLCTAHLLWGSADVKVQSMLTWEITLHVAQTVNTEQLQHYMP